MALDLSLPDRSRANELDSNDTNGVDMKDVTELKEDNLVNGYSNGFNGSRISNDFSDVRNDIRNGGRDMHDIRTTCTLTSNESLSNYSGDHNNQDRNSSHLSGDISSGNREVNGKPRLERQDSGSGRRLQPARPLALYPTWTNPGLYGVHLSPAHPPGSPAFPLPTSPLLTTPIPQSPLTSLSLPASPFTTDSLSASLPTSPLFAVNIPQRSQSPAPRSAKSVRFADSDPDLTNKKSKDDGSTMSWMKWKLLKRQLNDVESETVSSPKRISPDLPRYVFEMIRYCSVVIAQYVLVGFNLLTRILTLKKF